MTYLLMSLPFLGISLAVFFIGLIRAARVRGEARRYLVGYAVTTVALLVLTAVFDNIMMAAGFFDYGREQISGARFILMPLEDFFYPIAAAFLLAGLWQFLQPSHSAHEPERKNSAHAATHRLNSNDGEPKRD